MWKKADVKQILHCHRNPKDLEDIPPPPTLQSPQKMGEKEPLARIKAHSTTVNYLFSQYQSLASVALKYIYWKIIQWWMRRAQVM